MTKSIAGTQFRKAMGHYASGITIIAALIDDTPVGFTCQSFHSVSLDPRLICFGVMKTSTTWQKLRGSESFSINVLAEDQASTSTTFARSGIDRWDGVQWQKSAFGNPHLNGALLWLDCRLYREHDAGDHVLILASVDQAVENGATVARPPLLFFRGEYRRLAAF